MIIRLIASGDDFDPLSFLKKHNIENTQIFIKDAPLKYGKLTHKNSGFDLIIAEEISAGKISLSIGRFIDENKIMLAELNKNSIKISISIGLFVGGKKAFAPCLELTPLFHKKMAEFQIFLDIFGFPVNDDD